MTENIREDIIVLRDEEGQEIEFEYLDTLNLEDREYIVLLPLEESEEDEGTVVILEVTQNGDEEEFVPIDNEKKLNEIFELFKERMRDMYQFS